MGTKVEIKEGGHGIWWLVLALFLLSSGLGLGLYKEKSASATLKESAKLTEQNLVNAKDSLHYVRLKLDDTVTVMAAQTKALYMEKATLAKLYSKQVGYAAKLGARLQDIQLMQQTVTVTKDTVRVPVYIDTLNRHCAEYHDAYADITACIPDAGDAFIKYETRDSLYMVEYYKPHRFLFFSWKSRNGEYGIFSKNPKTTIVNFEVKKVIKK